MTPTLAVYMFGFDLEKIKYPYLASVESALALAGPSGAVYYCYCNPMGDDSPMQILHEFGDQANSGHLKILDHDWGDHHTIQAHIANYILDEIGTSVDYALKLDMDEVIHEGSFVAFRSDLEFMHRTGAVLGRPHYTHYLTENLCTQFIYRTKSTISRTKDGLRFDTGRGGDACAIGGASEFQTQLEIAHYGKYAVGREREAIYKERTFQELYRDLGFPDPIVVKQYEQKGYADYEEIFAAAKERGEFYECNDPHPTFVRQWLEESKLRSREFWYTIKESQSRVENTT